MGFKFGIPVDHKAVKAKDIRNLLEALATTNATSQADQPEDPRDGMLRIYAPEGAQVALQLYWSTWRTLIGNISSGAATQRKEKSFTSLVIWLFDHNLGVEPLVQCVELATGEVIYPGKIEHANENRVVVTHTAPVSGKIIVVG